MIPLRDNIPSRTTPVVNYAMIALCAVVFMMQLGEGKSTGGLVERFGMIPVRTLHPDESPVLSHVVVVNGRRFAVEVEATQPPFNPWFTLVTCIFLHGGWMHFVGNMWVLYIFGDNVEDRLGHVAYALFYVGCGIAASVAHLVFNSQSTVPTIGASGAIAGVMGAYMLFYPRATVLSIVPLLGFAQIMTLPAPLFLGIWFLLQSFQGVLAITTTEAGGVAWWAHVGGFAAGFGVAALLRASGGTAPAVEERRQSIYRVGPRQFRARGYDDDEFV